MALDWLIINFTTVATLVVAFALRLRTFVRLAIVLVGTCLSIVAAQNGRDEEKTIGQAYTEKQISGRPTLVVSVTDETEAEFAFKLAGVPFVVSNDRLHTILEGDAIARDELWNGFTFLSALPDITPLSENDVYLYGRPSTESNFILIAVERLCPTFREIRDCDPKADIARLFAMGSYMELSPEWPVGHVDGLAPFLYRRGAGDDPASPVPSDDIYDIVNPSDADRDSYISCSRFERLPVPHCEHRFLWKDTLRVRLTYKRSNIHSWQEIYLKSLEVLENMTRKMPEGAGNQTIYFPNEYYRG
ncbi:hypothetical protein [uncultured Devosia sp.]|uniref:hypothetical protein n=1 Tax=uncultured Devosia sp. TaxID=211434 RepID=UPI0030EB8CCF|tara:strand:+ start:5347 stop:6255 length:909 start_codon:yes stop_codon:yes gene_type:complete